ncbi:hypothetical protein [Escherichia coli]|nr:hypothetical protein [Escherichia coli]HAI1200086.1 hypothetical protein [Escherichia coli]
MVETIARHQVDIDSEV